MTSLESKGPLGKVKEILDGKYEKREEEKQDEGNDDDDYEEDAAIKYSVKDQMFGTPYFELHVREEYDKDAKDMKFVTSGETSLRGVVQKNPVVDFNDHAGEGHDSGGKIVEKETDDDDGPKPSKARQKKRKKCSPICKNTRISWLRRKRLKRSREETSPLAKSDKELRKSTHERNLLRGEIKNNAEANDDITSNTDKEAEKRRQERFKLVQEIRNAVIAKEAERMKRKRKSSKT